MTKHDESPVALVTGSSRGIGRAAACALAAFGFDVALTARTVKEGDGRTSRTATWEEDVQHHIPGSLKSTARHIEAEYGQWALVVPMDLMDADSVTAAVDTTIDHFGRLDAVVNNAAYEAVGLMDRFLDLRYEDLDAVLRGTRHQLLLIQRALPHLLDQEQSCVITTGSSVATSIPRGAAGAGGWGVAHGMTKAAVQRFAPVLHAEYYGAGLRAFSVDPGLVITDQMRTSGMHKEFETRFAPNAPEVPGTVMAWLATAREADELSGQTVVASEIIERHALSLD